MVVHVLLECADLQCLVHAPPMLLASNALRRHASSYRMQPRPQISLLRPPGSPAHSSGDLHVNVVNMQAGIHTHIAGQRGEGTPEA